MPLRKALIHGKRISIVFNWKSLDFGCRKRSVNATDLPDSMRCAEWQRRNMKLNSSPVAMGKLFRFEFRRENEGKHGAIGRTDGACTRNYLIIWTESSVIEPKIKGFLLKTRSLLWKRNSFLFPIKWKMKRHLFSFKRKKNHKFPKKIPHASSVKYFNIVFKTVEKNHSRLLPHFNLMFLSCHIAYWLQAAPYLLMEYRWYFAAKNFQFQYILNINQSAFW